MRPGLFKIGSLQLVMYVVQNRHTGEQQTQKGNYQFKMMMLALHY